MKTRFGCFGIGFAMAALAGAALAGCGSAPEQATESTGSTAQPLASVTRGPVKVDFVVTGKDEHGVPQISLFESSSAYTSGSPVEQLVAKRATTLEIFHALAGRDKDAPDALLLAHVAESTRLGRANADELDLTVDDTLIQKSATSCDSWVFADPDIHVHWANRYSYPLQRRSGATGTPYVTYSKAIGICNESDITFPADYKIFEQRSDGSTPQVAGWTEQVQPYTSYRLWETVGTPLPQRFYLSTAGGGDSAYYFLRRAWDVTYAF